MVKYEDEKSQRCGILTPRHKIFFMKQGDTCTFFITYIKDQMMKAEEETIIELYKHNFLKTAALVQKLGGDLETAKDIFHDAMIVYLEKSRLSTSEIKSPEAYLVGVVKILWVKKYGGEKKHVQLDEYEKAILLREEDYKEEDDSAYLLFDWQWQKAFNALQKAVQLNPSAVEAYELLGFYYVIIGQKGANPTIWTLGHRNPQGMIYDAATDRIWELEHGPKGGDELNLIEKGKNYGWPKTTYGIDYNGSIISEHKELPEIQNAVRYWVPSIAPCGMMLVTSNQYPEWKGNILVGALAFRQIARVQLDGTKYVSEEKLLQDLGRFRAIAEGPDGFIYAVTEGPGLLVKLVPQK